MIVDWERGVPKWCYRIPALLLPLRSTSATGNHFPTAGNVIVAGWATTRADGLDQLTSIVNVGALTAFIFVQASVVGYFLIKRQGSETPSGFKHGLIPVVGAILLAIVLINANPLALIIGAVWLAIGVVVYLVRNRRRV